MTDMERTLSYGFVSTLKRAIAYVGGEFKSIEDTSHYYRVETARGAFAYRYEWTITQFINVYKERL